MSGEFTANEDYSTKVRSRKELKYKPFSADEELKQGLFDSAYTRYVDGRGMMIELTDKLEKGDVLFVSVYIDGESTMINACCEVKYCEFSDTGIYSARLDFIIIKDLHKSVWDHFLLEEMEKQ